MSFPAPWAQREHGSLRSNRAKPDSVDIARTGVIHSEFDASEMEPVHFLRIWIQPATAGTNSSYEQIRFASQEKKGRLKLVAGLQRAVAQRRSAKTPNFRHRTECG
ncbi:MAG TPA: hypothetical protein VLJ11_00955 [Bryobacteraceae bacterium]|nr:hypothetical protein [Bryobacteraceae bacterium]